MGAKPIAQIQSLSGMRDRAVIGGLSISIQFPVRKDTLAYFYLDEKYII